MDLYAKLKKLPARLQPKVLVSELSEPIEIPVHGLALRVKKGSLPCELDGGIRFIWFPQAAIEFYGTYRGEVPVIGKDESSLIISNGFEETPAIITNLSLCDPDLEIRGILKKPVVRNTGVKAEKYTFYLPNFPDYMGLSIRNESNHSIEAFLGRITFENDQWIGMIDSIPETKDLRKAQKREGGFYISHVGEIRLKTGQPLDEIQLDLMYSNLRYLLGFCCGSWTGPLFPQGIQGNEIVWEQLAAWFTGSAKKIYSWFPTRNPVSELSLFPGFMDKINDPVFSSPLKNAIYWYIEANNPEIRNDSRIILMQVALEMLSWVYLVEYKQKYTAEEFNNFKAARKIRKLLFELKIPTDIPKHLNELNNISHTDAPGTLTEIRNTLVHSTENNRKTISGKLNGIHLYQTAQMGINLAELAILAICKYKGHYAQRGWSGWKGEDEILVPWANNPKPAESSNPNSKEPKGVINNDYELCEGFLLKEIKAVENMFDLYVYLYNKRTDKLDELNIAPAFFGLTGIALLETSLNKLSKIFDYYEDTINIEEYLNIIEQQRNVLFNDNYSQIDEALRIHRYEFEEKKEEIRKLKIIRNKHLAHNVKRIIKEQEDIYKKANLLIGEIHELIYWIFDVINEYRIIRGMPSVTYSAINKYDVDGVINAISEYIK